MRDTPDCPPFTPLQIARRIDELQASYPLYADPALWDILRRELIEPWRDWGQNHLPEAWAGVVCERLEAAEEHLTKWNLEEWDKLCEILCPECYYTPANPKRASQSIPGSNAKQQLMARRDTRGEALFHPDDLGEIPDHLGFLRGLNHKASPLQGEERELVGEDYNPARKPLELTPASVPRDLRQESNAA